MSGVYRFIKGEIVKQKLYAKDLRKAAKKLEKPIKGTVINCDTIRRGVKFLENRTKINLEKDFGVKKTI